MERLANVALRTVAYHDQINVFALISLQEPHHLRLFQQFLEIPRASDGIRHIIPTKAHNW